MSCSGESPQVELEPLAQSVCVRGWGMPVALLLQIIAPFGFLCSQVVTLLAPLATEQGREYAQRWAELLEDREQLEHLQRLIEMSDAAKPS